MPSASLSTAPTTSARASRRTARRWPGFRGATAASSCMRWTWPTVRNCAWPTAPTTNAELLAERQVHHVRDRVGGRRGTLAVVSVDGRVKQRLTTQAGDIREPNWGPVHEVSNPIFTPNRRITHAQFYKLLHSSSRPPPCCPPARRQSSWTTSAGRRRPLRQRRHRPGCRPAQRRHRSTPPRSGIDPLNDPKGVLAKRSVYFDFDSYVVQATNASRWWKPIPAT